MIDAGQLLADLQRLLKILENDLRQRCKDNADVNARVQAEYNKAKSAERTSQAYEVWRDEFITQVAASWILACVFVRFIEDNRLLDDAHAARVWLAGPGERLQLARDQHTVYFREHPAESDREYLEYVFRGVANPTGQRPIPVVQALFDEAHNPLRRFGLSGDGATVLLNFWQQIDPKTGALKHDFIDEKLNTRFLGDLYQDLSKEARKKYALLQTPVFVEEFILDRTLTPAIHEFGYQTVRLIDPTCGSGHFLLGAFHRLFDLWVRNEPSVNAPELARRALEQVHGVDLNPYAVAIARFRLLVAALMVSGIERLQDAPAFKFNLGVGDSLLHGPPRSTGGDQLNMTWSPMAHVYAVEEKKQLDRILVPGYYHSVVGNPPYIRPNDDALNKCYRDRFTSCAGKYALTVPFMERFIDLAVAGNATKSRGAGHIGMITSNSFMKREFGKRLIQTYFPRWDLTHVIDTSGAFIPGHGTPTIILFFRNQLPVANTVRTVMGSKGEPSTPLNPERGLVWTSIIQGIDIDGFQNEFVSVIDAPRINFHKHPWNIGGGGAAELKERLSEIKHKQLESLIDSIGVGVVTLEDDAFVLDPGTLRRKRISPEYTTAFVEGDVIRDWIMGETPVAIFPYDSETLKPFASDEVTKFLWPYRTGLRKRVMFKKTQIERGMTWFEYGMFIRGKYKSALSIAFAFVSTHNHFVLDRGMKVFKQSAPIIKLAPASSADDYFPFLGLLNSSIACFWMKQVFYPKATATGDISIEKGKPEANRYEFASKALGVFPVPVESKSWLTVQEIARLIQQLSEELVETEPKKFIAKCNDQRSINTLATEYITSREKHESIKERMVALQEELDWECYRLFGLCEMGSDERVLQDRTLEIKPKERPAFWTSEDAPKQLHSQLQELYKNRRSLLKASETLRLVETPVFKRLWLGQQGVFGHTTRNYEECMRDACNEWLLNRIEDTRYWPHEELTTTARLADRVRGDTEFMQVAEIYRGRSDFDVPNLLAELIKSEAVPFLPVLRYTSEGLRKHEVWEQVWDMQRQEDAIEWRTKLPVGNPQRLTQEEAERFKAEQIGDIPVPPKYKSTDFLQGTFWRLRGKLDVPKERFVSYAGCERAADPSLVIGWAGWDHLQQAQAIATYYQQMKTNEGWGPTRLVPLLSGIMELLPWLMQWHNEVDPTYGIGMGDFFKGFVEEEARALGLTLNKIRDWTPSEKLTTL